MGTTQAEGAVRTGQAGASDLAGKMGYSCNLANARGRGGGTDESFFQPQGAEDFLPVQHMCMHLLGVRHEHALSYSFS